MLKLKGSVGGVFRDAKTGQVTRKFEFVDNHIQDWFLKEFYRSPTSMPQIGANLFVSTYSPGKQVRNLSKNLAVGFSRVGTSISGVPRREVFYDDAPGIHLIQTVQRFEPPTVDFEIHSVGLCSWVSPNGDLVSSVTNFVWLENSCTQTTTESLDLFYRVQVLFEEDYVNNTQETRTLTPSESYVVTQALADESDLYLIPRSISRSFNAGVMSTNKINSRNLLNIQTNTTSSSHRPNTILMTNADFQVNEEFFKSSTTGVSELSNNIGTAVTHVSTFKENLMYKVSGPDDSPIQSVFGHRDTSNTPFYTASTAQLGLGNLTVNGDNWTDPDHPKYFKINITTSGLEGVGAYNFRCCEQYSFNGNTFESMSVSLHWSNFENRAIYDNFKFISSNSFSDTKFTAYPVKHSDNNVIFINSDEIAKMNIVTGEGSVVNNGTLVGTDLTPRFTATDINAAVVNNSGDVFVACRSQGVFRFNAAFDQLEVINNSNTGLENTLGCYGIDIGVNGRVWGFFAHSTQNSLYYSDDNGFTWTNSGFVDADIDAAVGNVLSVNCDRNNQHVSVLYIDNPAESPSNESTPISVKWWDQNTTTVSDGPTNVFVTAFRNYGYTIPTGSVIGYQQMFVCSPTQSVWGTINSTSVTIAANPGITTFGSSTLNRIAVNLSTKNFFTNWVTDQSGNDWMFYISLSGNGGSKTDKNAYSVFLNSDGTTYESMYRPNQFSSEMNQTTTSILVNDNLMALLLPNYNENYPVYGLCTPLPHGKDETEYALHYEFAYPKYGWNGTNWEKHNPNSKLIHSAEEELIEGITIGFSDNAGTTQFLDSDHYTFCVLDGIWLDGFTTFEYFWEVYTKSSILNTETESATLPTQTKVPNNLYSTTHNDSLFFADSESTTVVDPGDVEGTGTALDNDYNAGVRSANRVIRTDISPFIPFAVFVPGTDIKNAQGYVEGFITGSNSNSQRIQCYFGLSNVSRLGTTLDFDTIQYAIHVDSETPEAQSSPDPRTCSIRVVENGIERAVYPETVIIPGSAKFRIVLRNNASMVYLYQDNEGLWITLYESPPGSITLEDLYLDVNYVPTINYGMRAVTYHALDSTAQDYYMYLGNGIDQGVYHPEFVAIDHETVKLYIDGTEAVMIGRDDSSTTLATNTYSVYPYAGVIRFSAADAGKPVTAEYVTLVNE